MLAKKATTAQNKANKKNAGKKIPTQKFFDAEDIGQFAKRVSSECPNPLGFEFVFTDFFVCFAGA